VLKCSGYPSPYICLEVQVASKQIGKLRGHTDHRHGMYTCDIINIRHPHWGQRGADYTLTQHNTPNHVYIVHYLPVLPVRIRCLDEKAGEAGGTFSFDLNIATED
jgi:hypothetical protein